MGGEDTDKGMLARIRNTAGRGPRSYPGRAAQLRVKL